MNTLLWQKKFYLNDVSPLIRLSVPLMLSALVESSIGFFSTLFLAHLGQEELAAGALVSWFFATLMVILWGTLTAVSVLVSQKYGEKNEEGVAHVLRDGLLLGLIFVIPTFYLLWNLAAIFLWLGQSATIVTLAQSYLRALAWGVLPDFIMLILLQFLIGLGHTRISMTFMLIWVPIAIFCIYILIFGTFGLPLLGIAGIGWGMTLSYWITTIGLFIYLAFNRKYKKYFYKIFSFRLPFFLMELLKIGVPMGFMYCIEVGFFFALTLLMGLKGQEPLAANQITMQYLGQIISVIFSIAQAVTVRMGHLLGEKNIDAAKHASYAGIYISLLFTLFFSFCYLLFSEKLIAIDLNVNNPMLVQVVMYAKQFFAICALFQLFEAVRITLFGALRALKDTHFTLISSIICFWIIALPVGYILSQTPLASAGLWWGLVIGACFNVMLLSFRLRTKMRYINETTNQG